MQTFKDLDEGLLSSKVPYMKDVSVDFTLPLRLQKRALLKSIGFPIDSQLRPFRVTEKRPIKVSFSEYMKRRKPFLIVVSEKPLRTVCTPLFTVRSNKEILYRSRNNKLRKMDAHGMFKQISAFSSKESWVEFARILWGHGTIAGRLIYENQERQLLEIQEGIVPAKIGNYKNLPYFLSELNRFDCRDSFNFDRIKLRELGFGAGFYRELVERLCDDLLLLADSFEKLRLIAPLPTVEFAYVRRRELMAIDVDWPA